MDAIQIKINNTQLRQATTLQLNGSKSISNRLLLIAAQMEESPTIQNLSNARDTQTLLRLLKQLDEPLLDAGDAGTTYRFLTAFLTLLPGRQVLTGTKRMLQRPIGLLVDALIALGADIQYVGKKGFPPLQIGESSLDEGTVPSEVEISGAISSQYISALLLIAPSLPNGLKLKLMGKIVSMPYIQMTLGLMEQFGVSYQQKAQEIIIGPQDYQERQIYVESDWSAASYYYSIVALADQPFSLVLKRLEEDSLQGDAVIAKILEPLGIETTYLPDGALKIARGGKLTLPASIEYDCSDCPDLAQTLVALFAGLNLPAHLTGLETLRIKETDRIEAMKVELEKLGALIETGEDWIRLVRGIDAQKGKNSTVCTYEDHRMAMALAPLALKTQTLKIDDKSVVNKSYPDFWKDLQKLGFELK